MADVLEDVCTTPGRDASTASVRSTLRKPVGSLLRRGKGMPPQMTRFQVDLEVQNPVYFAGEELKGSVHVHLNDDLPVQGIILRIVGEAYVNVADEPRPWTAAKRLGKLKRTFKSKKISPSTFSDPSDTGRSFFFRDSDQSNWETMTTTTVSGPRSQKSTLQRDQTLPQPSSKAKLRSKKNEETKFRAHEKYFEHKLYVFGHRYSSTREVMWKGQHSFPFSYNLPSKLPVSFHGRFGYVRYFCEASLERHNQPTVQRRAFFSVSTIMDLNNDSKADSGVNKEKKTNSWCFCCPSGTIIVSAKIRKRGFVPGEMIPIQAYVYNVSNKPVHRITARIIQIATYFSSKGFQKRADETVICEKSEGILPPGESTSWDEVGPCVPPCPPSSTMIDCKLIIIDYRLEFVLDIPKAKEPLIIRMPLRIGTIPLEKVFKNLMDNMAALDFGDECASFPQSVHAKYPKLPAVFRLKCIKGDRNVNRYYFRQIPRSMQSMLGISSRIPLQPTISDDDETFAPRYLSYMMCPTKLTAIPEERDGRFKLIPKPKIDNHNNNAECAITQNGNATQASHHLLINVSPLPENKRPADVTQTLVNNVIKIHASICHPTNNEGVFALSNGEIVNENEESFNIASPLSTPCSPASFRSCKGNPTRTSQMVKKLELAHCLVNLSSWDSSSEGLRARANTSFIVNGPNVNTEGEDEGKKDK